MNSNVEILHTPLKRKAPGVKYSVSAHIDQDVLPKGKFVPIEQPLDFPNGTSLYTGYALNGTSPDLTPITILSWKPEVNDGPRNPMS